MFGLWDAPHPSLSSSGAAAVTPSTTFEISGGSQKLAVDRLAGLLMANRRGSWYAQVSRESSRHRWETEAEKLGAMMRDLV